VLVARGWLRPVTRDETPHSARAPQGDAIQRLGLVELTTAGGTEAARRLVVPVRLARRQHGVMSSDAGLRRFLRHLQHTLGANAVFVAFASAARRVTERGGDGALEEWRSAAACASRRFRPDGYGCYRRGEARFGFFVEFDRGTEKQRDYALKLEAYYRYRVSRAAKSAYTGGFPTLLVVTTSATAEARFAFQAYLAEQRHGAAPLGIFLTTTGHIDACPEGVLGPVWRSVADPWAAEPARICWLPRLSQQRPTRPGREHLLHPISHSGFTMHFGVESAG
jgi:Replication-relaxation